MTEEERLKRLIDAAAGRIPAELVIKNCRIVNPLTKSAENGDIAVQDGTIAGCGEYSGVTEIDGHGLFATAGLIDAHVHIESAMCTPEAFAAMVIPKGTTCVIADPHEIANVKGADGIHFMMNSARRTPLKAKFMIPSCVPATPFEDSGAELTAEDISRLLQEPDTAGLGEMMNALGVCACDNSVLEKILVSLRSGKTLDGHAPSLSGKFLSAYRAAGITTDHECTAPEEVTERIAKGMYVLLRQGSAAQNLKSLIPAVTEADSRRCLMCTDDKHPQDIIKSGHINGNLRIAVSAGLDPFTAVAMATINTAECYGLKNQGLIAPGFQADIVLWKNLENFDADMVFINGILQARDGKPLFSTPNRTDRSMTHTVNIKPFTEDALKIRMKSDRAKVISLVPHGITTGCSVRKVRLAEDGTFECQMNRGIQKLVVMERHRATGKTGLALIENYGITNGAAATTVAHDSHNIIAAGDNDSDIATAINALNQAGGGMVLVSGGKILGLLPLPVAGLMSDRSGAETAEELGKLLETAWTELGISREIEPFMTLSFLALPVIPKLKLTPRGLFDAESFEFTGLEAD